MAKIIDITDKLDFETSPALLIKGKKYEVNADAGTVLKLMGLASEGEMTQQDFATQFELIFPEKTGKELLEIGLSFKDLTVVVEEAINLITEGDEDEGEKQ